MFDRANLEIAYFVAGIVVALASLAALTQLILFKKDIRLRNERAAKEQAIVYATRFLTTYTAQNLVYEKELKTLDVGPYTGAIGDFSAASIVSSFDSARMTGSWTSAINELEVIASAFVSGVADATLGLGIIGRMYCLTVKARYDVIAASRTDVVKAQYQSIVTLYDLWSKQLTRADLEISNAALRQQAALNDREIASQGDLKIPTIG